MIGFCFAMMLIEQGGRTAVHEASRRWYAGLWKCLVAECGGDPAVKDNVRLTMGETPGDQWFPKQFVVPCFHSVMNNNAFTSATSTVGYIHHPTPLVNKEKKHNITMSWHIEERKQNITWDIPFLCCNHGSTFDRYLCVITLMETNRVCVSLMGGVCLLLSR